MDNQCLIVGCGAHAHAVISIVESAQGFNVHGLIDTESNYDSTERKSGYPIINSLANMVGNWSDYEEYCIVLAIGDNQKRREVFKLLANLGATLPNIISDKAFVDRLALLGVGNVVSHGAIVSSMANLGDNNLINTCAILEHDTQIGNHNHLAPRSLLLGKAVVGDECFVGAGVIVGEKVFIENNVIVGAASLVLKNVTQVGVTIYGVPAKTGG